MKRKEGLEVCLAWIKCWIGLKQARYEWIKREFFFTVEDSDLLFCIHIRYFLGVMNNL